MRRVLRRSESARQSVVSIPSVRAIKGRDTGTRDRDNANGPYPSIRVLAPVESRRVGSRGIHLRSRKSRERTHFDRREQILEGLAGFLGTGPVVVGQRCGLRASSRDRLPVMGRHPDRSQIALFNGFGSKGATWIPPLADHFATHLLDSEPLDGEVDLLRFTKRSA